MFKWVHLSDLHFQEEEGFNGEQLKNSLPDYLKEIGTVNALFLTGDFRYAKNSTGDIDKISEYIMKIAVSLKVDNKDIFCVPGNHDLERGSIRNALLDAVNKDYSPLSGKFDDKILGNLITNFDFFANIEKQIYGEHFLANYFGIHRVKRLSTCNVLLLNTAITAGRDEERGCLLLGTNYLSEALKELDITKPTIALGHHGASFLHREESKQFFIALEQKNVQLYLCGHEHALWLESCGTNTKQITTGCIWGDQGDVNVGFTVGTLSDDNLVHIDFHQWFADRQCWGPSPNPADDFNIPPYKKQEHQNTAESKVKNDIVPSTFSSIPMKKYTFTLNGHTLLGGRGRDGIKYYWKKNGDRVESIAFNKRLCEPNPDPAKVLEDNSISAYTSSISFGCILSVSNSQCKFCETGARNFKGNLSAEEIAMQNIFMASYDADCPSFPEVRNHKREFAFMGQGEPGHNYPAIKEAIRLINIAMSAIGQEIHRYIISTCGIYDFIPTLINDIRSGIFKNRIALHFSLHSIGETRAQLMPIDTEYNYKGFIDLCRNFHSATKEIYGIDEKIGVGILMFKGFVPISRAGELVPSPTTLDVNSLTAILNELDNEVFKIDLSDLNYTSVIEATEEMSNENAHILLARAKELGFETKIFSSFGDDKHSGCGMLKSEYLDVAEDGTKTIEQYNKSLELLHYSINALKN